MFKFLKTLDKGLSKAISCFLGFVVVVLLVITLFQVGVRLVINKSLGGVEELPMYLMIFGIWLGAANLSRENTHLRLDGIGLITQNRKILKPIDVIIDVVSVAAMVLLCYYMADYTMYCVERGMTTPGMQIPIYVVAGLITVCLGIMVIYKVARIIRQVKELLHGNFN